MMEALSAGQYSLVFNLLSLTIATMFAAGIFFLGARQGVAPSYRIALLISAVVVFIAGYHYFRILESWKAAFVFQDGGYVSSGLLFNDAYRYADWLITVPLLMVELIAVLSLARAESRRLIRNLTVASFAMILLGYPGEVASSAGTKWFWWALAMIPFGYILFVLFTRLSKVAAAQAGEVPKLIARARTLLVVSWWVYPLAFVLPMVGLSGAVGEVGLQVGYSIADITAKAGFGLVIYQIARAKSEQDGFADESRAVA